MTRKDFLFSKKLSLHPNLRCRFLHLTIWNHKEAFHQAVPVIEDIHNIALMQHLQQQQQKARC